MAAVMAVMHVLSRAIVPRLVPAHVVRVADIMLTADSHEREQELAHHQGCAYQEAKQIDTFHGCTSIAVQVGRRPESIPEAAMSARLARPAGIVGPLPKTFTHLT